MAFADRWRGGSGLGQAMLAGLAAGVLTAGITLALPDEYRSEVMVLPRGAAGGGPLAALAATAGLLGGGFSQVDEEAHYVDILESRWMGEKLLATEFSFAYRPWAFGRTYVCRETPAELLRVGNPVQRERALKKLGGWITANRDLKTGVLRVAVRAPSRELARQLADQAVLYLGQAVRERAQARNGAKAEYAKARLDGARAEEETARKALAGFARSHVNFEHSPDAGVRSTGERLVRDLGLRSHLVASLALAYEQAELEARTTVPVLSVLGAAHAPAEKAGPKRLLLVVLAALLGGAGAWSALNARRIREHLARIERERAARVGGGLEP